ncbi:MAG: M20/M25/M40 family metallo-hydrolase, partial [Planctomycetales bacterium]|nr:M20/M25/M40 family metallo-hydrolase [Planctomycetales bacterium]
APGSAGGCRFESSRLHRRSPGGAVGYEQRIPSPPDCLQPNCLPALPSTCVELLQAMVRIESVTPRTSGRADSERELGEYLLAAAESWGLATTCLPVEGAAPNLLLTDARQPDAPWWLFDSHLDTVGTTGMTVDPLAAEVREGRMYGRGACDTKASGAAMLWALKERRASGAGAANVALLFTVGEEAWQTGARAFMTHQLDRLPWRPSAVVVGEPTQMNIVRASNGYVRFKLRTLGRAAHSTRPQEGHNAISDMARAITVIEDRYISRLTAEDPLTGRSTCSINLIRGGTEHNVVPERCEVTIDHRLAPGQSGADALAAIRKLLDEQFEERAGFRYEIDGIEPAEPFTPELNAKLSEHTQAVLQAAGIDSTIEGAPYTTNANHYASGGLTCVVLGPGDIAQAHTKDEWIAVDQLELGVRGYGALMGSLPNAFTPGRLPIVQRASNDEAWAGSAGGRISPSHYPIFPSQPLKRRLLLV